MQTRSINEDRGARKAAELRSRFRKVSNASMARWHFGLWPNEHGLNVPQMRLQRRQRRELLVWSTLAAVVVFIAFVVM